VCVCVCARYEYLLRSRPQWHESVNRLIETPIANQTFPICVILGRLFLAYTHTHWAEQKELLYPTKNPLKTVRLPSVLVSRLNGNTHMQQELNHMYTYTCSNSLKHALACINASTHLALLYTLTATHTCTHARMQVHAPLSSVLTAGQTRRKQHTTVGFHVNSYTHMHTRTYARTRTLWSCTSGSERSCRT